MPQRKLVSFLLVAALAIATALVVVLTLRVQSLSRSYQRLALLSARPHAGIVVPTFRTATLEGDSVTVGEIHDSAAVAGAVRLRHEMPLLPTDHPGLETNR